MDKWKKLFYCEQLNKLKFNHLASNKCARVNGRSAYHLGSRHFSKSLKFINIRLLLLLYPTCSFCNVKNSIPIRHSSRYVAHQQRKSVCFLCFAIINSLKMIIICHNHFNIAARKAKLRCHTCLYSHHTIY